MWSFNFVLLSVLLLSFDVRGSDATYRLPNNTKPEAYHVTLIFDDFTADQNLIKFNGEIFIKFQVLENDTNQLTIHSAVNIENQANIILCKTMSTICLDRIPIEVFPEPDKEFLIISTINNTLTQNGVYYLYIPYTGRIYDNPIRDFMGVYRGSYSTENDSSFFIATHMQPTHARKVFPCYDEPKFKAKFYLTLIHKNEYNSISNMELQSEFRLTNDIIVRSFKATPLLPTYLIAFVISRFENLNQIHNDIEFRAFAREGQENNTHFGIETAIKALDAFEKAFDLKYKDQGMMKLDQVALPRFNFGGMENHGIIFYREDFLLYDEEVDTAYDKEYVAQTVVHEVCHKFLGNLVTPSWWSFLWLSEGFCKFYEYYMVKSLESTESTNYTEMRTDEMFVVETLQDVMIRDASPSIRPMTLYVESPDEVKNLFDSIAYSKSACVLRMFMYAFGRDVFEEGLHLYLSETATNSEGVAEPKNLYEAFDKVLKEKHPENNVNVSAVMSSWETQSGFPYIHVERAYFQNKVKFTQKRYLNVDIEDNTLWHIPITYATTQDDFKNVTQIWTTTQSTEIEVESLKSNDVLIVNIDQQGYFRVLYDDANWDSIAKFLYVNHTQVSPTTRSMILDDAFIFSEDGKLDMRLFMEILKYLEKESDWIPWYTASANILYMRRMLDNPDNYLYEDFRDFLTRLTTNVYNTYRFNSTLPTEEPHHYKHIRNIAINWACQAHVPECIKDTETLMMKAIESGNFDDLPNDHRGTIMCNGVRNATNETYEKLFDLYNSSLNSQILDSIGCIEDEGILNEFITKYDEVLLNHFLLLMRAVYLNGPIGLNVTLNFLEEEKDSFDEFISANDKMSTLNTIFTGMASRVNSIDFYDRHMKLMEVYNVTETTQRSANATMQRNLQWLERHSRKIEEFLERQKNSSGKLFAMWTLIIGALLIKLIV